jgi:nucleoside diphosphate kinase
MGSKVLTSSSSWTYVLVTPDALVLESLPWLVDKLRFAHLRPVAGRLIYLDSETMLRIYNPPLHSRKVILPAKRAFDLWYSLGPGCVLALHRDGPGACSAMLDVKGATDPRAARADSIRYAGENGLMNLVHCPDSETEAAEELTQLLGERSATDLQRLALSPNETVSRLTVGSLEDSLPVHSGRDALSVPLAGNKIRLRVVLQLAIRGASDEKMLSDLAKIRLKLRDEHEALSRATTSSDRFAIAHAHDRQLAGDILSAARQLEDPAAERVLLSLSALLTGSHEHGRATLASLHESGTYVSATESAVLELTDYL